MTSAKGLKVFGAMIMASGIVGFVFLGAVLAYGQASPASQVAVSSGAWEWIKANASWLVPLIVVVLSSLATGLSDYPKAAGVAKILRMLAAAFSVVQFKNGAGSLKFPMVPPSMPYGSVNEQPADQPTAPPTTPAGA